jgi:uncharacterized protein (DUF1330 family)
MSAYIIVEVEVHDSVRYEDYKKLTPASLKLYGGKFIVRGGKTELLEGDEEPNRIVILEFESVEKAKQWWNSPEYSDAKKIRHQTAKSRMIVVEGIEKQP